MRFRSVTTLAAALLLPTTAAFAQTLNANPGPANNGGSPGWAIFMDLQALSGNLRITGMTTASTAQAFGLFSVEVFVRSGTALGGPVGSGPGSSLSGWTSLGSAAATQGATANGISQFIDLPDFSVLSSGTTGVAFLFSGAGPRYFGTGTPPLGVYADANLRLTTGDVRSAPFTPTGSFFTSRELVGSLSYERAAVVVPEPSSLLLVVAGFSAFALARRRRA